MCFFVLWGRAGGCVAAASSELARVVRATLGLVGCRRIAPALCSYFLYPRFGRVWSSFFSVIGVLPFPIIRERVYSTQQGEAVCGGLVLSPLFCVCGRWREASFVPWLAALWCSLARCRFCIELFLSPSWWLGYSFV